jgi:hypothetical protein
MQQNYKMHMIPKSMTTKATKILYKTVNRQTGRNTLEALVTIAILNQCLNVAIKILQKFEVATDFNWPR